MGTGCGLYPTPLARSEWTPAALAPHAWYRADMGISLVGARIAAWADQSGNGHHLLQTTDALRPVQALASRGDLSWPAVDTAGGCHLQTTLTLPRELSIVLALGTVSSTGYGLSHTYGATETTYLYTGGPATMFVREISASFYHRTTATQPALVSNSNTIATYDGSAISVRRSGVDVSMSSPSGSPIVNGDVPGTLRVCAGAGGAGGASLRVIELILSPPLSGSQLAALEAYFARLGRP